MEQPTHINSLIRYRNTMEVGFLGWFLFLLTSWHLHQTFMKIWVTQVNESLVRLLYFQQSLLHVMHKSLRKCKQ